MFRFDLKRVSLRSCWVLAFLASYSAAQCGGPIVGGATDNWTGRAVAAAGDLDGDGWNDLIVGAPTIATGMPPTGEVGAYSGRTGGFIWRRPASGFSGYSVSGLGKSVAVGGDLDGDGVRDVFVGTNDLVSGQVFVLSGSTGATLWTIVSNMPSDRFGWAVADVGDLDVDGTRDLLIGAPAIAAVAGTTSRGWTCLVSGGALALLPTGTAVTVTYAGFTSPVLWTRAGVVVSPTDFDLEFGDQVASAGDITGDGVPDILIGAAPSAPGRAYVFSGAAAGLGSTSGPFYTVLGTPPDRNFGSAVASAGDADGDGRDDFLVAAVLADTPGGPLATGNVRLYSGLNGSPIRTHFGAATDDRFGGSIGACGDVDLDGRTDYFIGVPGDAFVSSIAGRVEVYSGATGARIRTRNGVASRDGFGMACALLNAVAQDGFPTLVVGAPFVDSFPFTESGAVTVESLATWPGTSEDLILLTGVTPGPTPPVVNPPTLMPETKVAAAGDLIELNWRTPTGTFSVPGSAPLILGQFFLTASGPPPAAFPGLNVNPSILPAPFGYAFPAPPGILSPAIPPGPGGSQFFFVPPGFGGISMIIQVVVPASCSWNGIFASTDSHVFRF